MHSLFSSLSPLIPPSPSLPKSIFPKTKNSHLLPSSPLWAHIASTCLSPLLLASTTQIRGESFSLLLNSHHLLKFRMISPNPTSSALTFLNCPFSPSFFTQTVDSPFPLPNFLSRLFSSIPTILPPPSSCIAIPYPLTCSRLLPILLQSFLRKAHWMPIQEKSWSKPRIVLIPAWEQ